MERAMTTLFGGSLAPPTLGAPRPYEEVKAQLFRHPSGTRPPSSSPASLQVSA